MINKTKYIVITDTWVEVSRSLKRLNKKRKLALTEDDFRKRIGDVFVAQLTAEDIDYERDNRKMSSVFMERLHKKDNLPTILSAVTIIMVLIGWFR